MSAFKSQPLGIAASIFLALYCLGIVFLVVLLWASRGGRGFQLWKLGIYALARLGAQICGIVSASLGFSNENWLTAYLILSLVGFTLILIAGISSICNAEELAVGESVLRKNGPFPGTQGNSIISRKGLRKRLSTWEGIYDLLSTVAMILLIIGISQANLSDPSQSPSSSGNLRAAGQIILLIMSAILAVLSVAIFMQKRCSTAILSLILIAAPFILVRGIYGVLSVYVAAMNFLNLENYYNPTSLRNMVIYQYVLETSMEFIAFVCLVYSLHFYGSSPKKFPTYVKEETSDGDPLVSP